MCKTLVRGTTIMGKRFIIGVIVVGGGFRRILVLMYLGL
jgi:hypothetical protein